MNLDLIVHHPDRNIDLHLSAQISVTRAGDLDSVDVLVLDGGVVWIGKQGFEFTAVEDLRTRRLAGTQIYSDLETEVDEAINEQLHPEVSGQLVTRRTRTPAAIAAELNRAMAKGN